MIKNNKKIMDGPRDPITNLWCVLTPTDNNNNSNKLIIATKQHENNSAMVMIEKKLGLKEIYL